MDGWVGAKLVALPTKRKKLFKLDVPAFRTVVWASRGWIQRWSRQLETNMWVITDGEVDEMRERPRAAQVVECGNYIEYDIPHTRELEEFADKLEIQEAGGPGRSQGVGFWNVSGLKDKHLPVILYLMQQRGLGAVAISDTRLNRGLQYRMIDEWKKAVPGGKIIFSPNIENRKVGGQCLLLNAAFALRHTGTWHDPSRLGIIMENTFWGLRGKIRILQVYWPFTSGTDPTPGQLAGQLSDWMEHNLMGKSVEEFMTKGIMTRLTRPAWIRCMGGDFNTQWKDKRGKWLAGLPMTNALEALGEIVTRSNAVSGTHIDHIMCDSKVEGSGYIKSDLGEFSDHRPIWVHLEKLFEEGMRRARKVKKYTSLIPTNQLDMKTINVEVAKILSNSGDEDSLRTLCRKLPDKFRIKKIIKNAKYWSPEFRGRRLWLRWLKAVNVDSSLCRLRGDMEQAVSKVGRDGDEILKSLQQEELDRSWIDWEGNPPSKERIALEIQEVQKQLHIRRMIEVQQKIMDAVKKRNSDPRRLFSSLGPRKEREELEVIVIDGVTTNIPEDIHDEAVRYFGEWYSLPEHQMNNNLWDGVQDRSSFNDQMQVNQAIPENLVDVFHKVTTTCEGREKVEEALQHLEDGPGFLEFKKVIKEAPKRKSGGPSGVTYTMLQCLNDANLLKIYAKMQEMWQSGSFPDWLNTKWLCPIPKTTDRPLNMNKMRPIMLVEVLRKLFIKPIVRQIRDTCEKYEVFAGNQYGFRSKRGCDQAIVQLLNIMERAQEHKETVFLTTWDIKRAFDSVQRPISELVLRRIGVPAGVAKRLAYIDEQDKVTPLTGWSKQHEGAASFRTEKGTGQGDTHSPLIWMALMDILLRALEMYAPSDIEFPLFGGRIGKVQDMAFADDLGSATLAFGNMQRKSDIYSAGCAIFRLDLAVDKFRSFKVGDGEPLAKIVVYNSQWEPTEKEFKTEGAIRYLGSEQDLDLKGITDKDRMTRILEEEVDRLGSKASGATAHLMYAKGATLPRVLYAGSFSMLSLKQLRQLDGVLKRHLKQETHVIKTFPNVVLSADIREGGLGILPFSDMVQHRKLEIIFRALRSDKNTREAIEGLLYRQYVAGSEAVDGIVRLEAVKGNTWLNSVVDFLQEQDVYLTFFIGRMQELEVGYVPIKAGQIWYSVDHGYREVLGWNNNNVIVQGWEPKPHSDGSRRSERPCVGMVLQKTTRQRWEWNVIEDLSRLGMTMVSTEAEKASRKRITGHIGHKGIGKRIII
jgi:hypothetical protein